MKMFLLIFLLFLMPYTLFGSVNRVNTSVLASLSLIPNIEYERQLSQHWLFSGRLAYAFKQNLDFFTNENFSFSSSTIILKRYFDTDLLGTYVAVGYQYKFFTLYSSEVNGVETEYTGGKLNEDTFLLEIGYSDIITETLYITAYLGISKYFVLGSEIITDESGTRARMQTIPFPYVGICLGYEF